MLNWLNKILHKLSHLLKMNMVRVVTWQEDEYIFVAQQCETCDEILPSSVEKIEKEKIYGKECCDFGDSKW